MPFLGSIGAGQADPETGAIDYRLDRRRILRSYRDGELSRHDVCDAQLELLRVAKSYSQPTRRTCPICDERDLREVRYVFGPRLPAGGRCVVSRAELERLAERVGTYRCYVIEVCTSCRWNHLLTASDLGSRGSRSLRS